MRWVVCILILIVAGVLVVRAISKDQESATAAKAETFAVPVITQMAAATDSAVANPAIATPEASGAAPATAATTAAVVETSVGTSLTTFAELNKAAVQTNAVFVYLPAKTGTAAAPTAALTGAAQGFNPLVLRQRDGAAWAGVAVVG